MKMKCSKNIRKNYTLSSLYNVLKVATVLDITCWPELGLD